MSAETEVGEEEAAVRVRPILPLNIPWRATFHLRGGNPPWYDYYAPRTNAFVTRLNTDDIDISNVLSGSNRVSAT
jgi:hypothetical protein